MELKCQHMFINPQSITIVLMDQTTRGGQKKTPWENNIIIAEQNKQMQCRNVIV